MLLLAAGVAALSGAALLARTRAAADAGARQQAAEIARSIDDHVGALRTELGQELEQAADIPQLRSALANRAVGGKIVTGQHVDLINTVKIAVLSPPPGAAPAPVPSPSSSVAPSPEPPPSALRALAATPGQEVTYTCVTPGSGGRIALNQ